MVSISASHAADSTTTTSELEGDSGTTDIPTDPGIDPSDPGTDPVEDPVEDDPIDPEDPIEDPIEDDPIDPEDPIEDPIEDDPLDPGVDPSDPGTEPWEEIYVLYDIWDILWVTDPIDPAKDLTEPGTDPGIESTDHLFYLTSGKECLAGLTSDYVAFGDGTSTSQEPGTQTTSVSQNSSTQTNSVSQEQPDAQTNSLSAEPTTTTPTTTALTAAQTMPVQKNGTSSFPSLPAAAGILMGIGTLITQRKN